MFPTSENVCKDVRRARVIRLIHLFKQKWYNGDFLFSWFSLYLEIENHLNGRPSSKVKLSYHEFSGYLTYPFGRYLEKNKVVGTALFHSEKQIWQELVTMRPRQDWDLLRPLSSRVFMYMKLITLQLV